MKKQSHKEARKNKKTLANILALLTKDGSSATQPSSSSSGPSVPSGRANLTSQLKLAGSTPEVAAGHGS
jgi:hypothetical protein